MNVSKAIVISKRPAYICDPEKNTLCTKEGCMIFNFCRCTTHKEFAKTGENGKPIVAVRSDMEESDYDKN